jgi:hypothetical protein
LSLGDPAGIPLNHYPESIRKWPRFLEKPGDAEMKDRRMVAPELSIQRHPALVMLRAFGAPPSVF